ncbi:MAG TPA: hypothetical protein VMF69_03650 [Gemmataceae bacterium]|nr:hypothetical protein [Gemmataceae bacterium]
MSHPRQWKRERGFTLYAYYGIVQDSRDLSADNLWGGPYAGVSLLAMCDGSVHAVAYSTATSIVIAMETPQGGEVFAPPY